MANEEHLALLERGVDAWNEWRKKNISVIPDFSEYEFEDVNLKRANLFRANFQESRFFDSSLEGALLREADLRNCTFHDTLLRTANLIGANLQSASLDDADCSAIIAERADFTGCDVRGTNFSRSQLKAAKFVNALLGTTVKYSPPHNAELRSTAFTEAKLAEAKFSECSLATTDTYLHESFLYNNEDSRCVSFERADLTNADLSNAILYSSEKAELFADFRQAILIGTNLNRANITRARLWESQRSDWTIRGVICSSASWDREGRKLETYEAGRFERAFATAHQILLEYPGGIELIHLALLPLVIEDLAKNHKRCEVSIKSFQDLGSRAGVVISVLDAESREDKTFEREFSAIRDKLVATQRALTDQIALRREAEAVLRYQGENIIPRLFEVAMKQNKTINIGQVGGNYVDAENADYVEVGRSGTTENVSTVKLGEFIEYLDTNSEKIKAQLSEAQWQQLLIASDTIKNETGKAKIDRKFISESIASLRKIAESASGSLLATAIKALLGIC